MPFPPRLLTPDEVVVVDLRPHPCVLAGPMLLAVVLLIPEGFGRVFTALAERLAHPHRSHAVKPDLARLRAALDTDHRPA